MWELWLRCYLVVASPTHESNASLSSEEEATTVKKRKVRRPSPSPRSPKSLKVTANDIATRSLPFASQRRHTNGMTTASQPNATRTGACNSGDVATAPHLPSSGRSASNPFNSSGVTPLRDHLPGVSRVPGTLQRSSISASQPNTIGDRLKLDRQKFTRSIPGHSKKSTSDGSALRNQDPNSRPVGMAKTNDYDSSSDDLPDNTALLRVVSGSNGKSKDMDASMKSQKTGITRSFTSGIACILFSSKLAHRSFLL